jgi:hypothetical protein
MDLFSTRVGITLISVSVRPSVIGEAATPLLTRATTMRRVRNGFMASGLTFPF